VSEWLIHWQAQHGTAPHLQMIELLTQELQQPMELLVRVDQVRAH
jgi:hypothetical protein